MRVRKQARSQVLTVWALLSVLSIAHAQLFEIDPQVRSRTAADSRVGVVEVAAHFVTTIRLPEAVNSVVVGDAALFQVEHSEHEPSLVFVKALTTTGAQTNLLISTTKGRQISLLLVTRGMGVQGAKVDFLVRFKGAEGFLIEPQAVPSALIGQSKNVSTAEAGTPQKAERSPNPKLAPASLVTTVSSNSVDSPPQLSTSRARPESLDDLLERQQKAPLPALYGERIQGENIKGDRLRAGISEVIDGGQQVVVLFSVVNTSKHAILLMPPQVQLGGKNRSGKIIKHDRWSTAEQLPIMDFRLNRRRVAPGERADGVVLFERPPYKQSNETLFLQMAESGAVDRPALAPIGFGVSSFREDKGYDARKSGQ